MLIAFGAWMLAHFLAYVLLRRMPTLRSEKGILLYHFGSAIFVGVSGLAAMWLDPVGFGLAGLILVFAVHASTACRSLNCGPWPRVATRYR